MLLLLFIALLACAGPLLAEQNTLRSALFHDIKDSIALSGVTVLIRPDSAVVPSREETKATARLHITHTQLEAGIRYREGAWEPYCASLDNATMLPMSPLDVLKYGVNWTFVPTQLEATQQLRIVATARHPVYADQVVMVCTAVADNKAGHHRSRQLQLAVWTDQNSNDGVPRRASAYFLDPQVVSTTPKKNVSKWWLVSQVQLVARTVYEKKPTGRRPKSAIGVQAFKNGYKMEHGGTMWLQPSRAIIDLATATEAAPLQGSVDQQLVHSDLHQRPRLSGPVVLLPSTSGTRATPLQKAATPQPASNKLGKRPRLSSPGARQ